MILRRFKRLFNIFFDKNLFSSMIKFSILIGLSFIAFNLLISSFARYSSQTESEAKADVAFYVIDAGTYTHSISLDQIKPSATPYVFSFYVSNNKNSKRCEVDLEYSILFKTTTNLPITYRVYKNENYNESGAQDKVSSIDTYKDSDETYLKRINVDEAGSFTHTANKTDVYNLVVDFPTSYKNQPDLYEGVVELITLVVKAKQSI